MVVIVRSRLALFVVAFALQSEWFSWRLELCSFLLHVQDFFLSAVVSPLAAELAAVARNIDGVGCLFILASVL
jgi:hypothetical protein